MKAILQLTQPALTFFNRYKLPDYFELIKFRLLSLILVSTSMGYYLGATGGGHPVGFLAALLGVACVGGGANALNQWAERDVDILMRRTRRRPLPSGRLKAGQALRFGLLLSAAGLLILGFGTNTLTLLLGLASWVSYLFLYTPLKRRSELNTWVGAVPGALPAVLGCAAARGSLDAEALALFLILFFWQMPHFFAISWVYREDYRQGGFRMLSLDDPDGRRSARQILLHTVLLLLASLSLASASDAGLFYLACAVAAGGVFMHYALLFHRRRGLQAARQVFRVSIAYLPALFVAIILDRLFQ